MTLQGVSGDCGVPLEVLYAELDLATTVPPNIPLRDLEAQVEGVGVGIVRQIVAEQHAQPLKIE